MHLSSNNFFSFAEVLILTKVFKIIYKMNSNRNFVKIIVYQKIWYFFYVILHSFFWCTEINAKNYQMKFRFNRILRFKSSSYYCDDSLKFSFIMFFVNIFIDYFVKLFCVLFAIKKTDELYHIFYFCSLTIFLPKWRFFKCFVTNFVNFIWQCWFATTFKIICFLNATYFFTTDLFSMNVSISFMIITT